MRCSTLNPWTGLQCRKDEGHPGDHGSSPSEFAAYTAWQPWAREPVRDEPEPPPPPVDPRQISLLGEEPKS